MQAIVLGAVVAMVILFFGETRGSVLLSRKAKAVNSYLEKLEDAGVSLFSTRIGYH
jgi:hypothetical protein